MKKSLLIFGVFIFMVVWNHNPQSVSARSSDLLLLARTGDVAAQFELGLLYYEGKNVVRDYVESYVWFALAASQEYAPAKTAATDVAGILQKLGLLNEAQKKVRTYFSYYVTEKNKGELPDDFIFMINGVRYQGAAAITPKLPITASVSHRDSSVTTVIMQHPGDPNRSAKLPIDQRTNLRNHDQHMRAGHSSTSEFIALDKYGEERGRIIVLFLPL